MRAKLYLKTLYTMPSTLNQTFLFKLQSSSQPISAKIEQMNKWHESSYDINFYHVQLQKTNHDSYTIA